MELLSLGGGLLGALFGGLFRLAPEVLKWLDRKNERSHELKMFEARVELEAMQGQQKLAEIGATREMAVDTGALAAFKAAIDQQVEILKGVGGFMAKLSASVRPVLTYILLFMYVFFKLGLFFSTPGNAWETMVNIYNSDDMALLAGVINYWMVDRTLQKRGLA